MRKGATILEVVIAIILLMTIGSTLVGLGILLKNRADQERILETHAMENSYINKAAMICKDSGDFQKDYKEKILNKFPATIKTGCVKIQDALYEVFVQICDEGSGCHEKKIQYLYVQ